MLCLLHAINFYCNEGLDNAGIQCTVLFLSSTHRRTELRGRDAFSMETAFIHWKSIEYREYSANRAYLSVLSEPTSHPALNVAHRNRRRRGFVWNEHEASRRSNIFTMAFGVVDFLPWKTASNMKQTLYPYAIHISIFRCLSFIHLLAGLVSLHISFVVGWNACWLCECECECVCGTLWYLKRSVCCTFWIQAQRRELEKEKERERELDASLFFKHVLWTREISLCI